MSGALVQGCMNSRRFNKQRQYLWAGGGVVLLEDGLEERETRRLLYLAVLWMVGSPHEGTHQSHREMFNTGPERQASACQGLEGWECRGGQPEVGSLLQTSWASRPGRLPWLHAS